MSKPIIEVENLSKLYSFGVVRSKSLRQAAEDYWNKVNRIKFSKTDFPREKNFDESQLGPEPNTFWSLKDVSFKVNQGEVVGVIGRNGAGKSTLLKILARITEPTRGQAVLRGRVASLLEVGTGFHPDLTGRENVYLNGAILGMRKHEINRKFDEMIAFAEVEKFIDTPVKHYSSGMYVRLAFAVAAHLDPEILLVDEVLAVGDAAFQKKCLGKMDEVAKAGKTVLFVSHNAAAVENLCSKALLIDKGALRFFGETKTVLSAYAESVAEVMKKGAFTSNERTGTMEVRFGDFFVEDESGKRIPAIKSGQDVVFVFQYAGIEAASRKNVSMAFGIHTLTDERLVVLSTAYEGQDFISIPQAGEFRCLVKNFPFAPNRYVIIPRLEINGREADFPYKGIGYIDVVEGDFYGTGRRAGERGICPYLLKGDWKIQPGN